jgi:hypothetical protein
MICGFAVPARSFTGSCGHSVGSGSTLLPALRGRLPAPEQPRPPKRAGLRRRRVPAASGSPIRPDTGLLPLAPRHALALSTSISGVGAPTCSCCHYRSPTGQHRQLSSPLPAGHQALMSPPANVRRHARIGQGTRKILLSAATDSAITSGCSFRHRCRPSDAPAHAGRTRGPRPGNAIKPRS